MNIRDYNRLLVENAEVKLVKESEEDWTQSSSQKIDDERIKILWHSTAPGSGAPSSVLAGAIQATQNLGYNIEKAEKLFFEGLNYQNDITVLKKYLSKIFYELNNAPVDKSSAYWKYANYQSWEKVAKKLSTQKLVVIEPENSNVKEKIKWGWLGQIAAGAFGTALEGYSSSGIAATFGEVRDFLKPPSTYNDDITFELALLKAFENKGKSTTSQDIAEQWIALIPFGWSAEDIALNNLRMGIYPPESGIRCNPYREWIGAQMRGSICGMIAPNNPLEAARIAWIDGEISHINNGILGEVFNAVMTSLAFTIRDARVLIKASLSYIPDDSLYYEVIKDTYQKCCDCNDVDEVLHYILTKYQNYNLVHALPNAAIEVVALYYGNGDFTETMAIIAKAGLDVDCNAGQVGNIVGIMNYENGLNKKWIEPIGHTLKTYVRTIEVISISELVDWTYGIAREMQNK